MSRGPRERALVRAYDRSRVSLALLTGDPVADPPRWEPPLLCGAGLATALVLATTFWPHAASRPSEPAAPPAHAVHPHPHKKGEA